MDVGGAAPAAAKHGGLRKFSPTETVVLVWLGVTAALATWGFIQGFVFSYAAGWYGNYYTTVWVCGFALVLCIQAGLVFCKPELTTARPARFWVWQLYAVWMFSCCLILLVGLGIALTGQFPWAFLWLPPVAIIAYGSFMHKRQSTTGQQLARIDVEAQGQQQAAGCCKAPCSVHWRRFVAFCGWSSIFWLVILGFFLALQAAWLAADFKAYPAPGRLYAVPMDGTTFVPQLNIQCKGPQASNLATILFEGGGGSPGVSYDPLVDALAARGRRACWYDRLGYGWSSDAINPTTSMRNTYALKSLLDAAGEKGPFIIAGHSVGGQLALLFAATYPNITAGVALLDSYDNVAIALQWMNAANVTVTLSDGRTVTRPNLKMQFAFAGPAVDAMRVLTPLGWARFVTTRPATSSWAQMMNVAYGNNKEWHTQWVEVTSMTRGDLMDTSDLLAKLSGRAPFWYGTSWPDYGAKPILLLPAAATINQELPSGCDSSTLATDATCQAKVQSAPKLYYAKLYLAYLQTLGANATMSVLPGDHAVWDQAQAITTALLNKFAGV